MYISQRFRLLLAAGLITGLVGGVFVLRARALWGVEIIIKNNLVQTAKLTVGVDPNDAWFTPTALMPGQSLDRTVTITNPGTAPVSLSLTAKKMTGYATVFNALNFIIKDGSNELYNGPLSGVTDIPISQEALSPGQTKNLLLTMSMPSDADSAVADSYTNITFTMRASQSN